jgi:hypothetical protein
VVQRLLTTKDTEEIFESFVLRATSCPWWLMIFGLLPPFPTLDPKNGVVPNVGVLRLRVRFAARITHSAQEDRGERAVADAQKIFRKVQNKLPDKSMATGNVSTQAISRLRTVPHCSPVWFAAMVPAMPDEST